MTVFGGFADDSVVLARDAQQRGQQALVAGDGLAALRWLDRAHRLAPHDGTITLTLASACLRRDNARAEALFLAVAEAQDVRAAWLGLAATRFYLGDTAGAAAALAEALARHVPEPALLTAGNSLADAIVRGAGGAGWCGVTGDGHLVVRRAACGIPEIMLDGRRCAGTPLPRARSQAARSQAAGSQAAWSRAAWSQAAEATVCIGGRHLLGSPIQLAAIRRVAGFVEAHEGGLRGWAWHPGDPDTDPALLIRADKGRRTLRITATDLSASVQHAVSLARPRGFAIPQAALAAMSGPLHVLGRDGADVLGSPLDPAAEQTAAAAAASALASYLSRKQTPIKPFPPPAIPAGIPAPRVATGASRRRRHAAVVIPVYGKAATVLACLESVLATVHARNRIIVIDDASPEPALRRGARRAGRRAAAHPAAPPCRATAAFPASANAGLRRRARGRDVVLLNSDTLVPPGWLERLRAAAARQRPTSAPPRRCPTTPAS